MPAKWTEEQLLDHIREIAHIRDRVPVLDDLASPEFVGGPGRSAYYRTFGSWSRAVRLAGYQPRRPGDPIWRHPIWHDPRKASFSNPEQQAKAQATRRMNGTFDNLQPEDRRRKL